MSRRFELLCVFMLGLGQMCIMTGFDTQSFVQESVLHSVNSREPRRIDPYAGYYGQAVCYGAYLVTSVFAPWIISIVGPKWTLFAASLCFSAYQLGFFYLNSYYYYASSAVMGVGFSLFYTACGCYLTAHSTHKTIDQNTAIQWTVSCLCMVVGGGILAAVFALNSKSPEATEEKPTNADDRSVVTHREFSDKDIMYMYTAFSVITVVANVIFALLPSREIEDCIEGRDKIRLVFTEQMKLIYNAIKSKEMLHLSVSCIHLGLFSAFWISVFPTSLVFTHSLADDVYLPAFFSLAVGVGETIMGCFLALLSRRIPNFGLIPTMSIGCGISLLVFLIIGASVAEWSTIQPTDAKALLFETSQWLACFTALLIGMADACLNTSRTVVCAFTMPHSRSPAFAISKFYQALGGCVLMFVSPYMSIYHHISLLICTLSVSLALFVRITKSVQANEGSNIPNEGETSSESKEATQTSNTSMSNCSGTSTGASIVSTDNNSI